MQVSVADNSLNETGFTVSRATSATGPWTVVKTLPAASGGSQTFVDTAAKTKVTTYFYKVVANNVVGDTTAYAAPAVGYPDMSVDSSPATASIKK